MKKCSKCNELKPFKDFNKDSQKIDNLTSRCKECLKSNYDKSIKHNYYQNNREEISLKKKLYYQNNKEEIKLQRKLYRVNNLDKQKTYNFNKKEKNNIYCKEYNKERKKIDIIFKLKSNIRGLICNTFKKAGNGEYKKSKRSEEILGCTLEEFINYMQSKFVEGMTLGNHGEWEMDHIIPISSAQTENDVIKLNHYSNFQPLWKEDNRRKSNKISYNEKTFT
jgi:hypothetical protein